jgi:23S rRNA pseudouridine2605 synthase
MQLNKYVAHAGIASRRAAVELIKTGKITVNTKVINEPGYRVLPNDIVQIRGAVIQPEQKMYMILNKPKGYITTVADERNRKTVLDLVRHKNLHERIYPVGRLDRDTTGLLVLTNDGSLAQKLSHPRHEAQKTYHVTLNRVIGMADMQKIAAGLVLEDGPIEVDAISYIPDNPRSRVRIQLHSGKNRIVRRIFQHLGFEVAKLDRVGYAGFTLKGLPRGMWRNITRNELELLKATFDV